MTASRTMIDEVPLEATHSCLEFFDPAQILVNYSRGYDEKVFTQIPPDSPYLEFVFSGAKGQTSGSVIDPRNILLELSFKLKKRTGASTTAKVCYVNNIMHSLFSNCELFLNGVQVSSANNLYPHKALIETETSHPPSCKSALECQGYEFEEDPEDIDEGIAFKKRRTKIASNEKNNVYGPLPLLSLAQTS